ncbi:MAG: hypothetical protein V4597_05465 [Pseudomonadota bacterium]
MALPIRPGFPQTAQPIQRPEAPRNAGQRAFFQAALGQQEAPTSAAAAQPTTRAEPLGRIPTNLPAEPPERILRPGSLLDIKV